VTIRVRDYLRVLLDLGCQDQTVTDLRFEPSLPGRSLTRVVITALMTARAEIPSPP